MKAMAILTDGQFFFVLSKTRYVNTNTERYILVLYEIQHLQLLRVNLTCSRIDTIYDIGKFICNCETRQMIILSLNVKEDAVHHLVEYILDYTTRVILKIS